MERAAFDEGTTFAVESGIPDSYAAISIAAGGMVRVRLTLPMGFTVHPYTGVERIFDGRTELRRYALTYGPILLAVVGPWDEAKACSLIGLHGLDPLEPEAWLQPQPGGSPLHFEVKGQPSYVFKPYFEVDPYGNQERFTTYPVLM